MGDTNSPVSHDAHTASNTLLTGCVGLAEGATVLWMWAGSNLPYPEFLVESPESPASQKSSTS